MISRHRYSLPFVLIACLAMFGGCIPEESPVSPFDRGPVRDVTLAIGADYDKQIYFNLETGTVVKTSPTVAWDLGFRSDAGGHHIVLNGSTVMAAANAGAVGFDDVRATTGAQWWNDRPQGSWDSTAIGIWWREDGDVIASLGHVYLIDRGYRPDGRRRGYVKMQMLGANRQSYNLRFANLDGSNAHTVTIPRDTLRTLTHFSFDSGGTVVEAEPRKDEWDFVMTRYTHVFYEPEYTPYAVTGVLLNRARTQAVLDTTRTFDEITAATVSSYTFTNNLNAVGYEWKWFDLNGSGKYTVYPRFVYVVRRTTEGVAFKIRFVDFYNDKGERGYPFMEWQAL